jgi:ABC-type branched-subunit amino acid transport system substrate-binding protein
MNLSGSFVEICRCGRRGQASRQGRRRRRRARPAQKLVDTVFGPVAFDPKGDGDGMTYDINVWHEGKIMKLP